MNSTILKTITFVRSIGIPVEFARLNETFLSGISITGGKITIDEAKLPRERAIADILHEAGHIAVTPSVYRPFIPDDADEIQELYDAYFSAHPDAFLAPEDPLARNIMQAGEQEAIAWSYAAAIAADIDPPLAFPDHPVIFEGAGPELAIGLSIGSHPGIHGLAAAGMTRLPHTARYIDQGPSFPSMVRWLQD